MGSLVAYGFLAYLLTRITPAHFPRRAAIALLAGLVLLIGFSRIYLGVHFMSDVIGGYAAGAVWLAFCIIMTHRTQVRPHVSRTGFGRGTRRHKLTPPSRSPQGRPCSSAKISWSGNFPGDRAPCHNAVIADSHACVHHGVIQRDSDDDTQEMNAPIVGKMTPPEVFLGRSEFKDRA